MAVRGSPVSVGAQWTQRHRLVSVQVLAARAPSSRRETACPNNRRRPTPDVGASTGAGRLHALGKGHVHRARGGHVLSALVPKFEKVDASEK